MAITAGEIIFYSMVCGNEAIVLVPHSFFDYLEDQNT